MNKTELRAITLIVKKLGWNDMPATVAISAIQKMINNDIAISLDCCGFEDEPEDALLSIATQRPVDNIWLRLFIDSYETLHDECLKHWALTYRPVIEKHMREGMSFEEASQAWDIPSKEWEWEMYQNFILEQQIAYDETIVSLKYSF